VIRDDRIGREFLLWIWFQSEKNDGLFRLGGGKSLQAGLGGRLVLESAEGRKASDLTWRGDASDPAEALWALASGRQIRQAEIWVQIDQAEWRFVVDADSMDLRSLRIPKPEREEEDDQTALGLERLYLVEAISRAMKELFQMFMSRRRSDEWSRLDAPAIRKWLSGARP